MVIKWCCMCKHCRESINHLFLHCMVATEMWSALLQLFGVDWVMPCRVSECLESWWGRLGNSLTLHIWQMVPSCVMRCIW
jgi:hypothetical protein